MTSVIKSGDGEYLLLYRFKHRPAEVTACTTNSVCVCNSRSKYIYAPIHGTLDATQVKTKSANYSTLIKRKLNHNQALNQQLSASDTSCCRIRLRLVKWGKKLTDIHRPRHHETENCKFIPPQKMSKGAFGLWCSKTVDRSGITLTPSTNQLFRLPVFISKHI